MFCVYIRTLTIVFTGLVIRESSSEVFTSVAKVEKMIDNIRKDTYIAEYLESFIAKLDGQKQELKTLAVQLDDLSAGIRQPDFDPKHPLSAFKFIRNHSVVYNETVTKLLDVIDQVESVTIDPKFLETTKKLYPTIDDYLGIAKSLFRLQEVYEFDSSDLSEGNLMGIRANPLSAEDCWDMSRLSAGEKNLYLGREWLKMALWLVDHQNDTSVPIEQLLQDMAMTAYLAGELDIAVSYCEDFVRSVPKAQSRLPRKLLRHLRNMLDRGRDEGDGWDPPRKRASQRLYDELCKGHVSMYEKQDRKEELKKLKCRYFKSVNPFYRYQLIKLEERSRDPYLVIFHEAFTVPEIEMLQRLGFPRLRRAKVVNKKKTEHSEDRISETMFLKAPDFNYTKPIIKRIEALTSLRFDEQSYEALQLCNYGFGGMYNTHYDFYPNNYFKNNPQRSQRIATFMIYMTDVEAGGATVFPNIPEAVFPKAGNAVFWYNTYRNGTEDRRMAHGGCPVIVGNKWLANQWIRSSEQEFTRPCALNQYM